MWLGGCGSGLTCKNNKCQKQGNYLNRNVCKLLNSTIIRLPEIDTNYPMFVFECLSRG